MASVRLRVDLLPAGSLGPGKIELLERIRETGSISAAARGMEMAYRRAWLLIDAMNQAFRYPVTETAKGGKDGGGARLTAFGEDLVARYRAMEREAQRTLAADLEILQAAMNPGAPPVPEAPADHLDHPEE